MVSPFTISSDSKKYFSRVPPLSPEAKKSIHIINFRGYPKYDQGYIESERNKLTEGINLLLREENPRISLEELYHIVEDLVQLDQRQQLLSCLKSVCEKYLCEKLEELLLVNLPEKLFKDLIPIWKYYNQKVVLIKNVYLRYDRSSKNEFKFNAIQAMCLKLFKDIIILNSVVANRLLSELLNKLVAERQKLDINREEIKNVLSMLIDLDVYTTLFENKFMEESKLYFQRDGSLITEDEMDIKTYLTHVNMRIKIEQAINYLPKDTTQKVLCILYREMIESHLIDILNKGFQKLMDENSKEYLTLLYNLFSKVSKGVSLLVEQFEKYVDDCCSYIVNKATDKSMIQDLIDLKDKLDQVIRMCFGQNQAFYDVIKTSFAKKINFKNSQAAQYLGKYLDNKLRSKNISEDELEIILDKVMIIFRYIHGKDVFEAFYRKDLAKRLIFDKSTNQDIERSIVVKLKEECGDGFTAKLEGMLGDINLSSTINSNFKEHLIHAHQHLLEKSDISILILSSNYWSNANSNLDIILPDELLNYQAIFSKYYVFIHSGRKLDWQPNLGHCLVRATFGNVVKELQVSLFQTLVLLLFNENDRLTSTEIQEMTKLEPKELIITLHSLACGKTKILLKESQENTVTMDDVFQFNSNFSDKLFRIKVNQGQLKESIDEQKATEQSVLADRVFQIDAAVVRILKRKRVISHNELLAELFNILDIPITPQHLKKRIEILIDKEYIKKDYGNPPTYTYIA